jgi:hypothetical protein
VHNPELAGFLSQAEPQSDEDSGSSGISGDDNGGHSGSNGGGNGWGAAFRGFRGFGAPGGEGNGEGGGGGYVQVSEQAAALRGRAGAVAAGAYERLREAEVTVKTELACSA